jgi:general secretion pathway protein G
MCNIRRKAGAEWCGTPRRSDLGSDAEPPGTEAEPLEATNPGRRTTPQGDFPVRQRLAEARKNQSGFTLIELLIVIVILGVLAGIVVFAVTAFTGDGRKSACKADMKSYEVAAEAYKAKTGGYPAGADSAARVGVLTGAGYLKVQAPAPTDYLVTLNADGTVAGALSAANGGGSCTA